MPKERPYNRERKGEGRKVKLAMEELNLAQEEIEDRTPPLRLKGLPMEILGTFALVYFGGLSLILFDLKELSVTGVALTHGFIYTIMIWMGDHLSGGYYNPALTMGDMVLQKLPLIRGIYIICAQIAGSFLASAFLCFVIDIYTLKSIQDKSILGFPNLNKVYDFKFLGGFLAEFISTFFLQFVASMVQYRKPYRKNYYAFCIGGTLTACMMAIGNISGGALNPARVIGPMFLTHRAVGSQAIFMMGPCAGAIVGALFYNSFFSEGVKKKKKKKVLKDY